MPLRHNPVAFLVPCHRVIRKTGAAGGYRWGSARKKVLLAWEASKEDKLPGGEVGMPRFETAGYPQNEQKENAHEQRR
jgi:hypothetical protein